MILGLPRSGITSLHHRLTLSTFPSEPLDPSMPTPILSAQHKTVMLKWWDLPGTDVVQVLWPRYYRAASAVVLVLDSQELEHLQPGTEDGTDVLLDGTDKTNVKELVRGMLDNVDLGRKPIVVFAAKSEMDGTVKTEAIKQAMNWDFVVKGHEDRVAIIEGSAKTGEGCEALLDFLEEKLRLQP